MPKFTFKNVELNNNIFNTGNDNFGGKYTPLSRTLHNGPFSNDRLDGGTLKTSSGYLLNGTDISTTTKGITHEVNDSNSIYPPAWAKGLTVQGHGGNGGSGGAGGNSRAWWGYDAWSWGGAGGSGGYGGYGYLRVNVNENDSFYITIGNGGSGGGRGSNHSSPDNNAHGDPGKPGSRGGDTTIGQWTIGTGGGGGGGGIAGRKVYDNWSGNFGISPAGAHGSNGRAKEYNWNNTALDGVHTSVNGGSTSNGWYNNTPPGSGKNGNKGRVIYRWNTSTVESINRR
jgi:hypothetical protein